MCGLYLKRSDRSWKLPRIDRRYLWQLCSVLLLLSAPVLADKVFYLEFVINGKNTGRVLAVVQKDNDWEVQAAEMQALDVKLDFPHGERFLLSEFPGASVVYDETMQRLLLTLPSNALPMQAIAGMGRLTPVEEARRDSGAFINYDFLVVDDKETGSQSSLWHELYWFGQDFYAVNRAIARKGKAFDEAQRYLRFESYYQFDNQKGLWGLTLGDVINATPNWGSSIRMGGIRFARDYELDPNLITYPLPEFFGESALPGSVDLLINDQLRWRDEVNPGPFSINTLPFLSGAGVAEVVTTDVQGQQARQRVNFYIASEILSPGLLDYDVTLGMRRKDFGFASDHYADDPVASASVRYGATSIFTPQLLLQAGEHLSLGGAGFSLRAGNFGVIEVSHTASDYLDQQGQQQSYAYTYSQQRFGVSGRYLQRRGMYRDLGNLDQKVLRDSQLQLALSFYDRTFGSFNLGYVRVSDEELQRREFATLSWNRYFASGLTLFTNINRQLYGEKDTIVSLALSVPLGRSGQASVGGQRSADDSWRNQVQAMDNADYSGGLGWRLGADDSPEENTYAALDWRNKQYELSASVLHSRNNRQVSGGLSGALIMMDNAVYASRFVVDAFALVDVGQENVPVLIGNQWVGNTNQQGKLLIPDLYSHLENRIAIDPDELPANAAIESIEQMVVPKRKGGVRVKFPVKLLASVLLEAFDTNQQPLPVGTSLVADVTEREFIVGWGGEVYIDNLAEPMRLYWEEGDCILSVNPPTGTRESLPRLGKITCQPASGNIEPGSNNIGIDQ